MTMRHAGAGWVVACAAVMVVGAAVAGEKCKGGGRTATHVPVRMVAHAAVDSKDILADRQEEWDAFTRLMTISCVLIAVVLALMAIFLT